MKRSYFKYIIALLLFGSNGIVASFIRLNSYEIVLLRTLLGSLLLVVIFLFGKGKLTFYKHKKQFLYLIASGVAMGTSWMLLYEAYARIGVSIYLHLQLEYPRGRLCAKLFLSFIKPQNAPICIMQTGASEL